MNRYNSGLTESRIPNGFSHSRFVIWMCVCADETRILVRLPQSQERNAYAYQLISFSSLVAIKSNDLKCSLHRMNIHARTSTVIRGFSLGEMWSVKSLELMFSWIGKKKHFIEQLEHISECETNGNSSEIYDRLAYCISVSVICIRFFFASSKMDIACRHANIELQINLRNASSQTVTHITPNFAQQSER